MATTRLPLYSLIRVMRVGETRPVKHVEAINGRPLCEASPSPSTVTRMGVGRPTCPQCKERVA